MRAADSCARRVQPPEDLMRSAGYLCEALGSLPHPLPYTTQDVLDRLHAGEWQLWLANGPEGHGVGLTTIQVFPQWTECLVIAVQGERADEWFHTLMDEIEQFAADHGCRYVIEHGRPGWERVGARRGYEKLTTTMRKRVDGN